MRRSQRAARTLAAETASSPLLEFWKTLAPAEKTPSALPSAQRPRSLANPVPFEKQPRLLSLGLPSTLNTAAQGGPPVGKRLQEQRRPRFSPPKDRSASQNPIPTEKQPCLPSLGLPGTLNTAAQGGPPVGKRLQEQRRPRFSPSKDRQPCKPGFTLKNSCAYLRLGLPDGLNTAPQGGSPVGKRLQEQRRPRFSPPKGHQSCEPGFTLKNSCAYLRLGLPGTLDTAPQGGPPVWKTLARATTACAFLRLKGRQPCNSSAG